MQDEEKKGPDSGASLFGNIFNLLDPIALARFKYGHIENELLVMDPINFCDRVIGACNALSSHLQGRSFHSDDWKSVATILFSIETGNATLRIQNHSINQQRFQGFAQEALLANANRDRNTLKNNYLDDIKQWAQQVKLYMQISSQQTNMKFFKKFDKNDDKDKGDKSDPNKSNHTVFGNK
jgi:hypothetical protein